MKDFFVLIGVGIALAIPVFFIALGAALGLKLGGF